MNKIDKYLNEGKNDFLNPIFNQDKFEFVKLSLLNLDATPEQKEEIQDFVKLYNGSTLGDEGTVVSKKALGGEVKEQLDKRIKELNLPYGLFIDMKKTTDYYEKTAFAKRKFKGKDFYFDNYDDSY